MDDCKIAKSTNITQQAFVRSFFMNGISINWGTERFYSGKSSAASYANDGSFESLISESQKSPESSEKNFDFSDMYVRIYQHSLAETAKDHYATMRPWMNTNYLQVPVAGDLDELMESIEKGIADGKSLRDILQNRIDRYAEECGEESVVAVGSDTADIILIDPDTGKVIDSHPKGRCIVLSNKIQNMDYDIVRSQADDLATFLRYAVFKKETDDPEKVSALISELKEKQSDYDTTRFLPIFSMIGEQGKKNVEYWLNLLGDDWGGCLGDEKCEEIADELMRILEERYSSNDSTDEGLLEEMEKMRFASAAAKIERRDLAELGLGVN